MIIACHCGARLKISDEKLTDAGVRVRCPKCGTVHLAARPRPVAADPPLEAFHRQQPAISRPGPPSAAAPAAEKRSSVVLIAHDSRAVYDMIDGVLKQAGITSAHASNGLEALKLAAQIRPRAMVVDVGLTGIYGFELCERLKADPDTKGIKIVLLSSVYGLTAYKRSPVNLYGADDYIEKHHIPDRLVPKLQRLLRGETGAEEETSGAAPWTEQADVQKEIPKSQMPAVSSVAPSVPADLKGLAVPEIPSILPKTPVTLASSRKRAGSVSSSARPIEAPPRPAEPRAAAVPAEMPARPAAPVPERPGPAPVQASTVPTQTPEPNLPDASVKLDAAFLEHEEYSSSAGAPSQETADPAEIEKAKRFARIIVSDIVLYNQASAAEGVRLGTFYDLLKDDIAEGRAVYEQRVPDAVRKHRDYLQEAFDDFLSSKKKAR